MYGPLACATLIYIENVFLKVLRELLLYFLYQILLNAIDIRLDSETDLLEAWTSIDSQKNS
jgi:hypothetical protein